jgi:hypothetical protein
MLIRSGRFHGIIPIQIRAQKVSSSHSLPAISHSNIILCRLWLKITDRYSVAECYGQAIQHFEKSNPDIKTSLQVLLPVGKFLKARSLTILYFLKKLTTTKIRLC